MAEVEEPRFSTLAERIAALNKQKNFESPAPTSGKRPPPPPPPNKAPPSTLQTTQTWHHPTSPNDNSLAAPQAQAQTRTQTPNLPPRPNRLGRASTTQEQPPPLPRRTSTSTTLSVSNGDDDRQPSPSLSPALPPRRPTQPAISPSLPPRRPSAQTLSCRRNSNSSDVSRISAVSNLSLTSAGSEKSTRKLPPTLDQAKLPPLPPTRREIEAKAKEAAEAEAAAQAQRTPVLSPRSDSATSQPAASARPSLPPRLPSRPGQQASPSHIQAQSQAPALPNRRLPPPPPPTPPKRPKSALQSGFSNKSGGNDAPPPIPLSSRPTFAEIDAASNRVATAAPARPASAPAAPSSCLVCRDFSGPDAVAAQYPAHALPRQDPIGYLAHVLCDPFPSATDKARAIFTWCHHNIAYDVQGFFGGCIPRGLTPADTIFSGKAVCEGYAKVYESIAVRAGLGCVVVGGHGKGFGFTPLGPGQRPPPRDPSGHAWNAVRLDGGEWKLIDACWGAGAVGDRKYTKRFAPEMFYLPNHIFGLKHFPSNASHFYLSDGRSPPTWEEYIIGPLKGEQATWYSNATQEGLNEFTFSPREKNIPVYGGDAVVRFQFSKICEHWDPVKNGPGESYLLMMKIHGLDGRKEDLVPLDHDGFWWWTDIPARDLGAPGQQISLYGLDTLDGRPARGVTKEEFLRKKGRCGMSWVGIAAWQLV